LFTSGRVDGVILHLGPHATDRHLWQVANSNVPTVLMNCYTEGGAGSVVLADEEAGAVAAQHLIDLGHRSVAFVAGTGSPPQSDRRRHGVERVLEASGYELWAGPSISVPADVAANGDSANAWWGRSMVQKLLRAPSPPTGIVVANVSAALGALAAAHEQGARVPHDVSIVGILDAWVADMTVPALTTVTLPLLELGSSAAELLMRIINDSSAVSERNIVVDHPKSQLIERSSTAPPLARKKGFGSTRSSARSGGGAPPARA
jgi:LacI family transcriptional regulator